MVGNFAYNNTVEGYSYVGGIAGALVYSSIEDNYSNSKVKATEHSAGGILGFLDNKLMDNLTNQSNIENNYFVGKDITSKANVGGIIGEIAKELYIEDRNHYYSNFIEANVISENPNNVSLGIGNMEKENQKLKDTYYYKYSKVNNEYPTEKNEFFISKDSYLIEKDLQQKDTYTQKLK